MGRGSYVCSWEELALRHSTVPAERLHWAGLSGLGTTDVMQEDWGLQGG